MTVWRCKRKAHDWFPPIEQRPFLPWESTCLRCKAVHVELPWGSCLRGGNHPLAEHYDAAGRLVPHPTCPGPA